MAFKAGFVMMSPDGDPTKHRASIKTGKLEVHAVVIEFMNFDQAVAVCKDLAQKEGVQSLFLCPSFHHEAVTRVVDAVGPGVAVAVARGDIPSGMIAGEILAKEGWLPEGH